VSGGRREAAAHIPRAECHRSCSSSGSWRERLSAVFLASCPVIREQIVKIAALASLTTPRRAACTTTSKRSEGVELKTHPT
jgi:hypothetical protein